MKREAYCIGEFNLDMTWGGATAIKYWIMDKNTGEIESWCSRDLEEAIKDNKLNVLNLKYTGNTTFEYVPLNTKVHTSAVNYLQKVKMLGANIREVEACFGKKAFIVSMGERKHTIIIPSDVVYIGEQKKKFAELHGDVKVMGGYGLLAVAELFNLCVYDTLDLTNFTPCNVINSSYLFYNSEINKITFGSLPDNKFYNVKTIRGMFKSLKTPELDISGIFGNEIVNAESLFEGAEIDTLLGIRDTDLSKATHINCMFQRFKTNVLDISGMDLSSVKEAKELFFRTQSRSTIISLNNIEFKSLENFDNAFGYVEHSNIDMSYCSFPCVKSSRIFYQCGPNIINLIGAKVSKSFFNNERLGSYDKVVFLVKSESTEIIDSLSKLPSYDVEIMQA